MGQKSKFKNLKILEKKFRVFQVFDLAEEKQDFERLLIFLNIKMSTKLNNIELSEKFMAMWREGQTLWDVMFPLYPDKNEKDKSLKRMSERFQIFSD